VQWNGRLDGLSPKGCTARAIPAQAASASDSVDRTCNPGTIVVYRLFKN